MDDEIASPDSHSSEQRKRKRSSFDLESERPITTTEVESVRSGKSSAPHTLAELSPDGFEFPHKRTKFQDPSSSHDLSTNQAESDAQPVGITARLPPEVWQQVFSFVPCLFLGRLLRVNRAFNSLLDPSKALPQVQGWSKGHLRLQSQEHVWSVARRLFHPGMPRPLPSMSELDMWKLIRVRSCQFCGRKPSSGGTLPPSPWSSGPGPEGVRIIWPFGVRSCGSCLSARLMKDKEVLLSPSSVLMPGLPFAIFTPSLNYVSTFVLEKNGMPPQNLQLTKYYFRPQVDLLQGEMDNARVLGFAAAEEWYKGLEGSHKQKLAASARWEQWQSSGELRILLAAKAESPIPVTKPQAHQFSNPPGPRPPSGVVLQYAPALNGSTNGSLPLSSPFAQGFAPGTVPTLPPKPSTPASSFHIPSSAPIHSTAQMPIQPHIPQPRRERTIRDVHQMKVERRAEIERRCLELVPPIMPSTLVYMDSFVAALQITIPLNDNAWEALKPRLLAQREAAEQREREQRVANAHLQAKAEERRQHEMQLKEARENLEREWEEMQRPVRDKIEGYADDYIREVWRNGTAVTFQTSPQFAADVLVHVRKRYFEALAQEDAMLVDRGFSVQSNSPGGSSRRLTLEHLKWVFDSKVKPWTENLRKELFLCSVCGNPSKYYALDAVIQHYASKHTSALSMGTSVVYWKAEWPEESPFDPQPSLARTRIPPVEYPTTVPTTLFPPTDAHFATETILYQSATSPNPFVSSFQHPSQAASPTFSQSRLPLTYQPSIYQQYHRARSPPAVEYLPPRAEYGHPVSQFHDAQQTSLNQFPGPQHHYAGQSSPAYSPYHTRPQASYTDPVVRPSSTFSHPSHPPGIQNSWSSLQRPPAGPPALRPIPPGLPGQPAGIYQVQIEELARVARDVWDRISGIKGMANSVKLKVIIHYVVIRFAEKFTNEPNLALFTDALNNSSQMKPLRTLDDLACKACDSVANPNTFNGTSPSHLDHRETYALPALLSHFQTKHIEQAQARSSHQTGIEMPRPDWKFDMVELPEDDVIRDIMHAPGIDFSKLNLIATVLPKYFPTPLPKIDPIPNEDDVGDKAQDVQFLRQAQDHPDRQDTRASSKALSDAIRPYTPGGRRRGIEVAVDDFPKFIDSPMMEAPRPEEPTRDDEYDPHQPAAAYARPPDWHDVPSAHPRSQITHQLSNVAYPPTEEANRSATYVNSAHRIHTDLARLPPRPVLYGTPEKPVSRRQIYDVVEVEQPPSRRLSPAQRIGSRVSDRPELDRQGPHVDQYPSPIPTLQQPKHVPSEIPTESMNAAEQFLNNFDIIATDAYPELEQLSPKPAEPLPPSRSSIRPQEDMPSGGIAPHDRYRTGLPSDVIVDDTARDLRPSGPPLNGSRKRTRSPDYDRPREDEYDPRMPEVIGTRARPLSPGQVDAQRHREAIIRTGDYRYPKDLPRRESIIRYDSYDGPHYGASQYPGDPAHELEPIPRDRIYYRPPPPPREIYTAASPELLRRHHQQQAQYADEAPVRYASDRPQYRYVDDPTGHFVDAHYGEPVEYVRVAPPLPRDAQPGAGGARYVVERPPGPRELPAEYVSYEGAEYRREAVFKQNGQLYTRAPPPAVGGRGEEGYQEGYGRAVRYQ